ncbi:restriction endonuclease [Arthrobacter crystallopoietes]|uniref:restriction endonuclease n=1 Tax=Crystallibacter crystallopoietes TaxID=37928 RepID=UPI0014862EA1|nr:restriction endonuclease [Arthrobacter crystallopoietes]
MTNAPLPSSNDESPATSGRPTVVPLPWASRISGMPYMPGGGKNQVQTLETLLSAVDSHDGLVTATVDLGDGVQRAVRDAVKQIAPAGFINHLDREHLAVSEEAQLWMSSRDAGDLLAILHRHVRFVGELLHALTDGPKSVRELMDVAAAEFQLQWTTLDQVRRRVTWMSAMGLAEYKTNTLIGLTDAGREAVASLQLGGPERISRAVTSAVTVPELPQAIAALLGELSSEVLASRNPALGYIPRGNGETDLVESLYLLVNAASPSISRADLLTFAQKTFGVSESSFSAVMTTLNKSGLLEQTGFNIYSPSKPASAWLETQSTLDLVLLLHRRFLFMLEILPMLAEFDKAPDLARAAYEHYGMARVDVGGVRTRLQLLKAAGLIAERANWRYQATALGERIALEIPLQTVLDEDDDRPTDADDLSRESGPSMAKRLGLELETAAIAGETPIRLEKAVADAFSYLGFEARHIGGGGKTDVLATVEDPHGKPVRVILDAKAARSGTVNEGAVSFDTLAEHKEKHNADFVALVGPGFDGGRVRARAEQNGVALITVEDLSQALRRHEITPRSAATFLNLVDPRSSARKDLESGWSQAERRIMLLSQVVAVLAQEAREADEVTHGALSAEQIYLIVRDEIDPRPSTKDIEEVLQLLEHPLVASVSRTTGGPSRSITYRLTDAPGLVAAKVEALGRSLARVDSEG